MTEPAPLSDVAALVTASWNAFRARVWLLLGLMGASTAAMIVLAFVGFLLSLVLGWLAAIPIGMAAVGAALWIMTWGQVATCEAALAPDDAVPTFMDCVRSSWPKIMAFSWVCLLYLLIVGGASMLFIVPGVFLAVALMFAPIVCVEEGLSGVAALTRSMQLARGRWPALFGRLVLIAVIGALPGAVPVIGPILGSVLSPLPFVAMVLLYRQAKISYDTTEPARWPLALAAAAWLLPLGASAMALPGLIAAWPEIRAQAEKMAAMDPKDAQKLLEAVQSGKSGPETALLAAQLLNKQSGESSSVELSSAPAEGEAVLPPVASEDPGR